jgi:hypothetical protein
MVDISISSDRKHHAYSPTKLTLGGKDLTPYVKSIDLKVEVNSDGVIKAIEGMNPYCLNYTIPAPGVPTTPELNLPVDHGIIVYRRKAIMMYRVSIPTGVGNFGIQEYKHYDVATSDIAQEARYPGETVECVAIRFALRHYFSTEKP